MSEKQQIVPPFNKKDIEEIVKEVTKNTLESYPKSENILMQEAQEEELTPEILDFILHCLEVGKIRVAGSYYLSLNFLYVDNDNENTFSACFGCKNVDNQNDHDVAAGCHYEISVTGSTYSTYFSEV